MVAGGVEKVAVEAGTVVVLLLYHIVLLQVQKRQYLLDQHCDH